MGVTTICVVSFLGFPLQFQSSSTCLCASFFCNIKRTNKILPCDKETKNYYLFYAYTINSRYLSTILLLLNKLQQSSGKAIKYVGMYVYKRNSTSVGPRTFLYLSFLSAYIHSYINHTFAYRITDTI